MAKSGKGGRPRKYNKAEIEELKKKFEDYINKTTIPIIAEFAYKNDILRDTLYNYREFGTLIKKCIDKKTSNLEIGALANKVNVAMAIFSLKQMGWSDRQDITSGNEPIKINFSSNPKGCVKDTDG